MKNIFLTIGISLVLLSSCSNSSLYKKLSDELEIDNTEYVIVATDLDCISCAFSIAKMLSNKQKIKGIYFSKHPKDALIKLKKIFPNIQWKQTHHNELLHYLRKQKEEGPYLIKITGRQAYLIDKTH